MNEIKEYTEKVFEDIKHIHNGEDLKMLLINQNKHVIIQI